MKRTPLKRKFYTLKRTPLKRGASVLKRSPLKRKATRTNTRFRIVLPPDEYDKLRQDVLIRDGFQCRYCGGGYLVAPHHIIFRSHHHGDDSWENLISLCQACHTLVHAEKLEIIGNALDAVFKEKDDESSSD